jgi:TonB-linked SusC/RagA family outer membrane protein
MRKFLLLSFMCYILALSQLLAQEHSVSGRVTSAKDGSPLPGVNVVIKGTTSGTVTDASGLYTINVSTGTTLQYSFIGMISQEVVVEERTKIDVDLSEDATQLSEVIVVGYGTQERADVTGSISKVKGADIQNLPVTSYEQSLQGRIAGVQISSPSAELGAATRIRIRGSSSITANNQPLVVIDGFIVTSDDQTNFIDNNGANPLADLNPNDIESVAILKDANAAAIYGARASNGVILITTKRGAQGKTKFSVNYSTGFSKPTHVRKFLNAQQYADMFTAAALNAGYAPNAIDTAWADAGGGAYSGTGSFSDLVSNGYNADWNKSAFRTGRISQYDLSAGGGSDKTQFFTSFAFLDQEGIIIGNDFKRFSGRVNLDHAVNDKIKIGASINQIYSKKNNVPENNSFGSPLQGNAIAPIIPFRDDQGDYNDNTFYGNPYRAMANFKDLSTQWRNFTTLYGSWNIRDGLTFRSEGGVDFLSLYEYGWNGRKVPNSVATPSSGKYGTSRVINFNVNNTLTYNKLIANKHDVEFLLGQSFQRSDSEYSFIQALGLPTDDFKWLGNASQNQSFSSASTNFAYVSVFGRLNYKFNNKYLLSASLRNDGSSRFGQNSQYGWFPSASVGWIVTEESFLKDSNFSDAVNFFKIKASIGVTGNSEISNFASRGLYTSAYFGDESGLYSTQLANNDLSWEKTTQFDVGIEYELWQGKISGGVDYYNKKTNGLLLSLPIDPTSGYISTLRNLGKMTNNGWDIYLNTRNLNGKFKWSTSFNISTFTNKVTDLNGQSILPSGRNLNAAIVGQPLGVFYGVKYAGVDSENGDALYYLADGTTTANWSNASQAENYRVLGNPNPKHYGGITNNFEYGGFDLSIMGQWSYGNEVFNSSGVFQQQVFSNYGLDNQTIETLDYWKQPGDVTDVPRPDLSAANGNRIMSRFISDGSYFRFKTVTLGYNLPVSIVNKIKFSTVRLYVTAQNILTVTNYKGNDPEVNYTRPTATTQSANLTSGVDYYSAPQAKSVIFGIKLGF